MAGELAEATPHPLARLAPGGPIVPAIVAKAGDHTARRFLEFFTATIRNRNTRAAYAHAVARFLDWCGKQRLTLGTIEPMHVAAYVEDLTGRRSAPTVKQHLAALRMLFDRLVNRHVCIINPATTKAERYSVVEGKTPEIAAEQARTLLRSIDVSDVVGLRNRAVLAVLVYTAARVGAVVKLTMKNLVHDGSQYTLRFSEKGDRSREIPVRHDLEQILRGCLQTAGIAEGPLFRTAKRKTKTLTKNPMTGIDVCRMMKRRLKVAGLPGHFSSHSFRVATVTDLLEQNVPLEDVQYLAGHADPRTTGIYDRRRRKVARNIVERISI